MARRLRRAADADDPFAIFNAAQEHMLALARAHVDRSLLKSFVDGIESCLDAAVRLLLERRLRPVRAVDDRGRRALVQEHGRLTPTRSKAVIAEVADLCAALRPFARVLVDAFGIPDEAIVAPIALGDEERRQNESRAAADAQAQPLTDVDRAVTA